MKKSVKTILLIIPALLLTFVIVGLIVLFFPKSNQTVQLIKLAHANAFGTAINYGPHSGEIKILERDEFGRILYRYSDMSQFYPKITYTYIICQKLVKDYAYCYPDICFEIVNKGEKLSNDRLDELKARNDWNKPLDESKELFDTGSLSECDVYKKYIGIDELQEVFLSQVKEADVDYSTGTIMRIDEDGKILAVMLLRKKSNSSFSWTNKEQHVYFMILDKDHKLIEGGLAEVDDIYDYRQQLSDLKQSMDWHEISRGF